MTAPQKYNPQWKNRYQSLTKQFAPLLNELVDEISHAGSTSVEGLASNPIIGIDVVVEDFNKIEAISSKMLLAGYKLSSPKEECDQLSFKHNKTVAHDVRLVKKNSKIHKVRLSLKKHLQENPTALNELNTLNQKLQTNKISAVKFQKAKLSMFKAFLNAEGLEFEISDQELDTIFS